MDQKEQSRGSVVKTQEILKEKSPGSSSDPQSCTNGGNSEFTF